MFSFFKHRKKDPKAELKQIIGSYELQSFPSAVLNTLSMLRDSDSSINEIADQIQMDPGMHVRILRIVNSVAFGLLNKVGNLHHAVTLLGRSRLESLVLSCAVTGTLPTSGMSCMLGMPNYWLVSARRACLARNLALHLHAATQAESFTAALLQDMAIPVLIAARKDQYCDLLDRWMKEPGSNLAALEQESLGYDHAEVGALMAGIWELPDTLVGAISGHHAPDNDSGASPAVRLVSLLTYNSDDDGSANLKAACLNDFGMAGELVDEMIQRSRAEAEQFSNVFR